MSTFLFFLGREPYISLAELHSLFDNVRAYSGYALIDANHDHVLSIAHRLGGTIKIGKVCFMDVTKTALVDRCAELMSESCMEGKKLRIAVDTYPGNLGNIALKVKDVLKKNGHSVRVVQHESTGRVKNATTIHEKMISQGYEAIVIQHEGMYLIAQTVWVQDIEGYTARDIGRERSMQVGMMPPKLAQMMINFATKGSDNLSIWDPFCGLGTTLIEAHAMGYTSLIASDLSADMVQATRENMKTRVGEHPIQIDLLDARKVHTHPLHTTTCIVTEGMLGKNFTSFTIRHNAVMTERREIATLYTDFFASAFRQSSLQTLVCTLPFWNIGSDTVYLPEISALTKQWHLDPLCRHGRRYLVHMRPGQCVGREIVILRRD